MAACPIPGNASELLSEAATAMNAQRQRQGQRPLAFSAELQQIAQRHACDMAEHGIRSHTGTSGATFARRYRSGGGCGAGGENIAWGQRSGGSAVEWWMNSPPHRANILHRRAAQYGIAVAVGNGTPNWVMVVGRGC
jgi:uncharacterized protein YkwD